MEIPKEEGLYPHGEKLSLISYPELGKKERLSLLRGCSGMNENSHKVVEQFIKHQSAFINGQWIESKSGFLVRNKATNEPLLSVADLGETEVLSSIESCKEAFSKWSITPEQIRSRYIRSLCEALRSNIDGLSLLITLEQGKPLSEAKGEAEYALSYLEWFSEEAKRIYGDVLPSFSSGRRVLVFKEPVGVVAAITPWNFPLAMIARKLGAALAAGCTFVVKPAPETPLSALALASIAASSGLPPGVFNVVTGDAERIAKVFMESETVRKVSFTGSTEVGKILMRQGAETVKKLTLELGGNAPFIVFEDADLEKAAEDAMHAKFRNCGQTCISANRILVHRKVKDAFAAKLTGQMKKLKVGNGLEKETSLGPLISDEARNKVSSLIKDAVSNGASLAFGSQPKGDSNFIEPVLLDNVTPSMRIAREEIFGPVATLQTFDTDEEAIRLANQTEYGLASYLYTSNLSRALKVTRSLEFGMVGVNDTKISAVQAPFGGVKHSGFGREGSKYGIEEYLNLKYVSIEV